MIRYYSGFLVVPLLFAIYFWRGLHIGTSFRNAIASVQSDTKEHRRACGRADR